jgi:hypothetical protein
MVISSQTHSGPFYHDLKLNINLGNSKSKGKKLKNSNSARSNNRDSDKENNKIKAAVPSIDKKKKKNVLLNKVQLTDHTIVEQSRVNPKLK